MPVTDEIFKAFLECETKALLKFSGEDERHFAFGAWQKNTAEDFKQKCRLRLRSSIGENEYLVGSLPVKEAEHRYRYVFDCPIRAHEVESHLHALERLDSSARTKHSPYIPVRFIPSEKLTRHDKLLLAFDALALYTASGKMPAFGKLIYGNKLNTLEIKFFDTGHSQC